MTLDAQRAPTLAARAVPRVSVVIRGCRSLRHLNRALERMPNDVVEVIIAGGAATAAMSAAVRATRPGVTLVSPRPVQGRSPLWSAFAAARGDCVVTIDLGAGEAADLGPFVAALQAGAASLARAA
jgi:hypothetical protein